MFSWFRDKREAATSRPTHSVPLPPTTSTFAVPPPMPGTTPALEILPPPRSPVPPRPPAPAHVSAVLSALIRATDVPSPVPGLVPSQPPPPPPPPNTLAGKLKAIYVGIRQSLVFEAHRPAWLEHAFAKVNTVVGPYRDVLVVACVAIQKSPFAEFVIPISQGGILTVNDVLTTFLGARPFDPLEPGILLAKNAVRSQADIFRKFIALAFHSVIHSDFMMAKLDTMFDSWLAPDALPFPFRGLRIQHSHSAIRWLRAVVWAAWSITHIFVRSWFSSLLALLPGWLQTPLTWLFPPSPPFTLFLEAFDNYISNELPTHLIRLEDMRLVGRDDIRKALRSRIEAMTEADLTFQTLYHNLLNPNTQVPNHFNLAIQRYLKFAIFSHRWGAQEPSFRDMMNVCPETLQMFPHGPGLQKLLKFCEEARRYQCAYAWSDTCCINKESSSELEEAIRSMYRWYKNAEICIAYLGESLAIQDFWDEPWFTRGWTLQELLAPRRIKFYGKYWAPISWQSYLWRNDKLDASVLEEIEKVTSIPKDDLKSFTPSCSRVYEKMIWASKRRTTRVEDQAYCLLGIFDVSMPISYGEGPWAFHRLMEVIFYRCGESGIFAWCGTSSPYSLAIPLSPACYSKDLLEGSAKLKLTDPVAFTLTKDGLDVELFVISAKITSPHQRNKQLPWDEPRPSLQMTEVRFHDITLTPKWSLRKHWPKNSVKVRAEQNDLQHSSAWAIGIVCSRDGRGLGTLDAGKDYMWLLLGKVGNGRKSAWVRLKTQNISTIRVERNVQSRLQIVHIPHRL